MDSKQLVRLAQVFETSPASKDFWEEYGISQEDIAVGLYAVLTTLGFSVQPTLKSSDFDEPGYGRKCDWEIDLRTGERGESFKVTA